MKITGKTIIFKNERDFYSTSISNKKEDGTYENMYISVNFRKGIEVDNKTQIEITDGFLSFYKTKEGLPKLKLVILDFETEQEQEENFGFDDKNELPF